MMLLCDFGLAEYVMSQMHITKYWVTDTPWMFTDDDICHLDDVDI